MSRRPGEARRARRGEQRREIEVLFEMVGEVVEHGLDLRVVFDRATRGPEPCEEGATELVAGEEPVQIAAGDPSVGADRAVGPPPKLEHRTGKPGADGDAEMHLIAPYRHAARDLGAGGLAEPLLIAERRLDLEKSEPRRRTRRAFAAAWVGDLPAQHL